MTEPPQRSWLGRHWKWLVPAGCLTSLALLGGFVALILTIVFGAMKSSSAYTDSLEAVRAHPPVQQAIGQPIEPSYFVTGNISTSFTGGHADITYGVAGPKGSASVHAVASKSLGKWTFSTLIVTIEETGEQIDLLVEDDAAQTAAESLE